MPPVPARSSSQLCVNENCSTRLPQGTKFCTDCGTEQVIVKERPCFKCSRRLSVGHKFCFNCGANQSEAPHEGKEEEKKKKHCCFKCSSKLLEGSEFCSAGRYSHEHKEVEASTSSPTQHRKRGNMTGMDYLRMKEEAYKESQRKKGVKEEDLLRLPELVEAEQKEWEEQRQSEQQRQDPTSAQRVSTADDVKKKHLRDLKQFASVNMLQNDYVVENSEADRMVQLEKNGKSLLQSIKVRCWGCTVVESLACWLVQVLKLGFLCQQELALIHNNASLSARQWWAVCYCSWVSTNTYCKY